MKRNFNTRIFMSIDGQREVVQRVVTANGVEHARRLAEYWAHEVYVPVEYPYINDSTNIKIRVGVTRP